MTRRIRKLAAPGAALALWLQTWPLAAQSSATGRSSGWPPAAGADTARASLSGGVPTDTASPATVRLTLSDAIARGLAHNLAAVLAREDLHAAGGARLSALAGLLPALSAAVITSRAKISLEEFGLPVAPGESPLIGPFNVVRGQVALSQAVIDLSAIEKARAGQERLTAARRSLADTRELVIATCAALYLQAVAGNSRVESARAQLATAQALATRAQDMKDAGAAAGIEVLRANVQLAAQRQRLIQAENEAARQKLALARAIGLPLEQDFELVDRVPYASLAAMGADEATAQALAARSDLKSAEALLRAAADDRRAALGQALPSLHVDANLGAVGPTAESTKRVYTMAASLRVPLFEGGRAQAQLAQSTAALEQQRARVADLRARIEYEVRSALLDLKAAADQVSVAEGARSLAEQQLAQTADRFSVGVTGNVEVVQAQQALADASESYITSLLAHNLAKLSLARALGATEEKAGRYLEGGE